MNFLEIFEKSLKKKLGNNFEKNVEKLQELFQKNSEDFEKFMGKFQKLFWKILRFISEDF